MLSADDKKILERVIERVPQYRELLERKLQEELKGLPSVASDKVQVFQGRAKLLQELLAEFVAISGK